MKYAYFNQVDGRVVAWIDTDLQNHVLPDSTLLHECTTVEWDSQASGDKMVKDGEVVDYSEPEKTLAQLKAEKSAYIRGFVSPSITAGIVCDALGSSHTYPTSITDQQNITGLVAETLLPGAGNEYKFWCADLNGVWARRIHTLTQIQAVGIAIANHVKANQAKYEIKLAEIAGATTKDQLDLVVW